MNSHLIGFTLDDPGKVGDPLRFRNDAEYSSAHKVLAQTKARQPKEWLKTEGVIEPGEVGATKFLPAKFKILDKGMYEMGAQKTNFLETFLNGSLFKGRFIFRKLPRREEHEKAGKQPFVWFAWKPINQSPYVISQRAISLGWIPPKGRSAMPKEWEDKVPPELKWWEKNWEGQKAAASIKEIRKLFLKRDILTLESAKFVLQRRWWKGQKVIRDMPVENWWLKLSNGMFYELDSNPLVQKKGINSIKKILENIDKEMKFEGEIPPGKPGNPNKKIPAHVEILDKGSVEIIESTDKFMSFRLAGTKLKGFWIAKKSDGAWIIETSQAAPKPVKLKDIDLTDQQKAMIMFKTKFSSDLSLADIARVVGCSKQSVVYWQNKAGMR